jgi:hypothetical protein
MKFYVLITETMCFVRITEQRVVTCLKMMGSLTFINELGCVYCAVRNESLNSVQVSLTVWRHRWCRENLNLFREEWSKSWQTVFNVKINHYVSSQVLQLQYDLPQMCYPQEMLDIAFFLLISYLQHLPKYRHNEIWKLLGTKRPRNSIPFVMTSQC